MDANMQLTSEDILGVMKREVDTDDMTDESYQYEPTASGSCLEVKPEEADSSDAHDGKTSPRGHSVRSKRLTHGLTEKTGDEPSVECPVCSKSFSSRKFLKQHELIHSDEKRHKCAVCEKSFRQSGQLRGHERIHTGERKYRCPTCDMAFTHGSTLNMHVQCHTGAKPYTCFICDTSFTRPGSMRRHLSHYHGDARQHGCPHCAKAFKTKEVLEAHVRTHTGAKPYSCRHCSMRYKQRSLLSIHLLRCHDEGNWHTCDVCQKKFIRGYDLRMHSQQHVDGQKS